MLRLCVHGGGHLLPAWLCPAAPRGMEQPVGSEERVARLSSGVPFSNHKCGPTNPDEHVGSPASSRAAAALLSQPRSAGCKVHTNPA